MSTPQEFQRVSAELTQLRNRLEALAEDVNDEWCEWGCNHWFAESIRALLERS